MSNITPNDQSNIIIYNTIDGKAAVALYAKDGRIWLNQLQMAELFATSKQTISYHISNILKEKELEHNSVVKDFLTTANDGKQYHVIFYSLEMILMIGYQAGSKRKDLTLDYWRSTADGVLAFHDKAVLQGKGSVSNAEMEHQVNAVYKEFNTSRKAQEALEADQEDMKMLEEIISKTNRK